MYSISIISAFIFLFIHHTYEQDPDVQAGSFEVREHSLNRPYPAGLFVIDYHLNKIFSCLVFSTANSYWHLTGNTLVTDRFVRLTSDSQSKAGGLWNTIPVAYPDWEMHVHFKVHGVGKELFGDGFAIWYVRDPKLGGMYKDLLNSNDNISDFDRTCFWLSRSLSWLSDYYGYIFQS
jgi:hypothetical protein